MAPRRSVAEEEDDYIPFILRFKAWWHGVHPNALVTGVSVPMDLAPTELHAVVSDEGRIWPPARQAFCQRLWGSGFIDPGGRNATLDLLKPCDLGPQHTLLDLTTGLAGGSQAISDTFGIWIDALEPDPDLAKAAHENCQRKGYGKRVKVSGFDPNSIALKKRRYDCIFVRERFHTFDNKPAALGAIRTALKPKGQLILTDFVRTAPETGPAIEKWLRVAGDVASIPTTEEYRALLAATKFDVLIAQEDPTDFRRYVLGGWSDFMDQLEKKDLTREFVNLLLAEAERWLALTQAIDAGEVSYLRIHAMGPKFVK